MCGSCEEDDWLIIKSLETNISLKTFEFLDSFESRIKVDRIMKRNEEIFKFQKLFFKKIDEIQQLFDCQFYFEK